MSTFSKLDMSYGVIQFAKYPPLVKFGNVTGVGGKGAGAEVVPGLGGEGMGDGGVGEVLGVGVGVGTVPQPDNNKIATDVNTT